MCVYDVDYFVCVGVCVWACVRACARARVCVYCDFWKVVPVRLHLQVCVSVRVPIGPGAGAAANSGRRAAVQPSITVSDLDQRVCPSMNCSRGPTPSPHVLPARTLPTLLVSRAATTGARPRRVVVYEAIGAVGHQGRAEPG